MQPSMPSPAVEILMAAADFVNLIGKRDKGLQKLVLQVLDSYNKEAIGEDELSHDLVELLKGDPELLDGISKFLPVTEATPIAFCFPQQQQRCSKRRGGDWEEKGDRGSAKRAKPGKRKKLPHSSLNRCSAAAKGKEQRREKEPPITESTRVTPSYLRVLQPEKETTTVLNTSYMLSASATEWGMPRRVDRREGRLNRMEDELFEADMVKEQLMSAAKYAEGKRGDEMMERHFKKWLKAMYGGRGEAAEVMLRSDPIVVGRVVKSRLCQLIGELTVQRWKMTAKIKNPS